MVSFNSKWSYLISPRIKFDLNIVYLRNSEFFWQQVKGLKEINIVYLRIIEFLWQHTKKRLKTEENVAT